MKMTIDVTDRREGDAIRMAMEDPETRAYVVITGLLLQLPDMEARRRVLHCAELLLFSRPASPLTPHGQEQLGVTGLHSPLRLHGASTGE